MGKNSKRRKGTWAPHPVDSGETGAADDDDGLLADNRMKKRIDDSSLKRRNKNKNKTANTPALRQLLGDSFPRRKSTLHFDHLHNEEERFADLSDIVATDWRAEARMPHEDSASSAQDEEELYQSRKLVMRQLVMNQLSFIRQHFNPHEHEQDDAEEDDDGRLDRDGTSDVDSWQEMEERFAEIYEPIPYHVAMDSWRSMTREQMLQTVTSRRLRSRMKYMSRAEILSQIQSLKSRHSSDQRLKSKSPVYEDMSGSIAPPSAMKPSSGGVQDNKKKKKVKIGAKPETPVQKMEPPIYQNTSAYPALSLADIYQAKVEARRQELRRMKSNKSADNGPNSLYVTRALVHAPPSSSDEEEQQRFVSRAGILSRLGTPSTAPEVKSKSDQIAQFWRQNDYITTEYSRTLCSQHSNNKPPHSCSSSSPSSSCPSDCDGCCDGGEACSMCSCSSCGSTPLHNNKEVKPEPKRDDSKTPEPVPLSLVKQRKMEFEQRRILEQQENRLQELVRRTRSESSSPAATGQQSWADIAQRTRQLEEKLTKRSSGAHAIYEPVPASQLLSKKTTTDGKKSKKKTAMPSSKKRSKIIKQLKTRMKENMEAESLDPRVRQRRHQELQDLLSDAMHGGTQTLTNINLGLIYVPMEEQQESKRNKKPAALGGALMTLKTDRSQLGGGGSNNMASTTELIGPDNSTDEGEDVFGSIDTLIFEPKAVGVSTNIKRDELLDVEEKIAQQFDYLNDYGSCREESSADETNKSPAGSKNGRKAAVAAVTSPPHKTTARSVKTDSCAAAASCDVSASDEKSSDSDTSVASFTSVIYQGQKLLKEQERIHSSINKSNESLQKGHVAGSTLDSEHYTNVDTDASWDYYPDGGVAEAPQSSVDRTKPKKIPLAVGNLRNRPPSATGDDETDETARLLKSLRMAEEANVSTSLRLIFPTNSMKLSAAGRNVFTDLANEALDVKEPVSLRPPAVQPPPDIGFRSLPDMTEVKSQEDIVSDPLPPPLPPVRKRDTMIRELKMRLRDKFHCVGDDDSTPPSSQIPINPPTGGAEVNVKRKAKVMSKLESILSSFNALAQMKAEGRVYRTVPEPMSLPAEYYTNDGYESADLYDAERGFHSTGYPHHLLQPPAMFRQSEPPYDSTYDDIPLHYAEFPLPMEPLAALRQQQMAQLDPRLRGWYDNALFDQAMSQNLRHESLYDISEPLAESRPVVRKPSNRQKPSRSSRKKPESTTEDESTEDDEVRPQNDEVTWSDIDNQLIADVGAIHPHAAQSRMAPYHDEWLFWDQLNHLRLSEADRQRWEEERARRMLLWIHHSQGPGSMPCQPHWWQVRDGRS